jgi:hypothetical protein
MNAPADLWAITSYFNPARYRRRLTNYRLFRQHLKIPLVTAELSFGGAFDLQPGDADVLVQLRDGDVMWQKERLLNIALQALPNSCRKVVWMDCDTIVGAPDWPARVSEALDDFPVVQPYGRVHHLQRDASVEDLGNPGKILFSQSSLAWAVRRGYPARNCLNGTATFEREAIWGGFMWAARRDLVQERGLHDACILGGGDFAFACAAFGCFDVVILQEAMNERQRECYLAWAEPFFQAVRAEVIHVDCPIYHLWHGCLLDRHYEERQQGLHAFHFDPYRDIALTDNQVWRWNSDKPLLHQYVRDYFALRKEDG